jgi:hypothetical protein
VSASNPTAGVGGLVGQLRFSRITNSHATGQVSNTNTTANSKTYAGGLIGEVYGSYNIGYSYATGEVNSSAPADTTATGSGTGGLIGGAVPSGTTPISQAISNSFAEGKVEAAGSNIGGLIGYVKLEGPGKILSITNVYHAKGDLISTALATAPAVNVGGLIGYAFNNADTSLIIDNAHVYDTTISVANKGSNIGGLIGKTNWGGGTTTGDGKLEITNSSASGQIVGKQISNAGGLVGGMIGYKSIISNSETRVNILLAEEGTGIGGLVGQASGGQILDSQAYGNVSGRSGVGGLVGGMSVANGNLGDTTNTNLAHIESSAAFGDVTGYAQEANDHSFGGLVGYNEGGMVDSSYSLGVVTYSGDPSLAAANSVGGLIGVNLGTVSNSYWNSEANPNLDGSGQKIMSGALDDQPLVNSKGLTTAQLEDSGISNAILTGGDVETAIENKNAADAVAQNPGGDTTGQNPGDDTVAQNQIRIETASAVQQAAGNQTATAVQTAKFPQGAVVVGGLSAPPLDLGNSIAFDASLIAGSFQGAGNGGESSGNSSNAVQDVGFAGNVQNLDLGAQGFTTTTENDERE